MKQFLILQISELQRIQVTIDEKDKINIYGYDAEGLHIFDEIEVEYICQDQRIVLARDIARRIVSSFVAALEESLKGHLPLNASFAIGSVGCFFSKKVYMSNDESEKKDDIFSKYWVWSSPSNIQTWLYNVDSKIYLEISPTYSWLFSDLQENEQYIAFDEYENSYKPILLVELQKPLVQLWINQCHALLQQMETVL